MPLVSRSAVIFLLLLITLLSAVMFWSSFGNERTLTPPNGDNNVVRREVEEVQNSDESNLRPLTHINTDERPVPPELKRRFHTTSPNSQQEKDLSPSEIAMLEQHSKEEGREHNSADESHWNAILTPDNARKVRSLSHRDQAKLWTVVGSDEFRSDYDQNKDLGNVEMDVKADGGSSADPKMPNDLNNLSSSKMAMLELHVEEERSLTTSTSATRTRTIIDPKLPNDSNNLSSSEMAMLESYMEEERSLKSKEHLSSVRQNRNLQALTPELAVLSHKLKNGSIITPLSVLKVLDNTRFIQQLQLGRSQFTFSFLPLINSKLSIHEMFLVLCNSVATVSCLGFERWWESVLDERLVDLIEGGLVEMMR